MMAILLEKQSWKSKALLSIGVLCTVTGEWKIISAANALHRVALLTNFHFE